MNITPVEIPEKITDQHKGEIFRFVTIERPDLQLSNCCKVRRLPFRSNAYYFTHDMWITQDTLIFETILNPQSRGTPDDPNYSMIWKGKFSNDAIELQVLVPPTEKAYFMHAILNPSKTGLFYGTDRGIFKLNLSTLTQEPIIIFSEAKIQQRFCSISMTCDELFLIFATWKIHLNDIPNGHFYAIKLTDKTLVNLDIFQSPFLKTHLDASPTDPNLLHYCMIKEHNYPRVKEMDARLWLMDLSTKKSHLLYTHKYHGILRKPELITHEAWGNDGTFMTAVVRRNWIKKFGIPSGNDEIIMDGSKGKQNPWHCDGRNGKKFVFDTMNKDTGLWIGNFRSADLFHLCRTAANPKHQAFHPHPFFSPNLNRVFFNSVDSEIGYLHFVDTE